MNKKKISLKEIEKVMSPKEMKNVKGGSCQVCSSECSGAWCAEVCFGNDCWTIRECCF